MDIDADFPLKFYLNLNKHDDRRRKVLNALFDHGITDAERIPALDGRWVRNARGYKSANRYAQALTHKVAIWRARQRRAPAVMIFEDDVVFAGDLRERLSHIMLPDDWGILLLGCQHLERPKVAGAGFVRCLRTWDMHAYAVRAPYYTAVMRILTATKGQPEHNAETCDTQLQRLQRDIPCYAVWPNLAWQPPDISYAAGGWRNDNYLTDGRQSKFLSVVAGLDREMKDSTSLTYTAPQRRDGGWLNWEPENSASGLGDRMRGLAAMQAVAEVSGKTLRLLWQQHEACPGSYSDVLEASGYVVVEDLSEWQQMTQGQERETSIPLFYTMSQVWDSLSVGGGTLADSGETASTMEDRWRRMVRRLRVHTKIVRRADDLQAAWGARRLLGVHVRRTDILDDWQKEITRDNQAVFDEALLSRVVSIVAEGKTDGILLACDNSVSAAEWRDKLGVRGLPVFQTAKIWNPEAMRQSSLEDAMLDLYLLSRCDRIVGSTYSSFAFLAAELGGVDYERVGRSSDR